MPCAQLGNVSSGRVGVGRVQGGVRARAVRAGPGAPGRRGGRTGEDAGRRAAR